MHYLYSHMKECEEFYRFTGYFIGDHSVCEFFAPLTCAWKICTTDAVVKSEPAQLCLVAEDNNSCCSFPIAEREWFLIWLMHTDRFEYQRGLLDCHSPTQHCMNYFTMPNNSIHFSGVVNRLSGVHQHGVFAGHGQLFHFSTWSMFQLNWKAYT